MILKVLGATALLAVGGCVDMIQRGVQGSGKLATEERATGDFTKVQSKGAFDVTVKVGEKGKLKLEGDDNLLKMIETKVDKGVLKLSSTESINPKTDMKITVYAPMLEAFELLGAGDVDITGLRGSAFKLEVKGAGDIEATGEVNDLNVVLRGAGDVSAFGLRAQNVKAEIFGAGDIDVWATESVEATVYGVGDLRYKGKPKRVSPTIKGMGSIEAAE